MMDGIKAITLDLDNTLLDRSEVMERYLRDLLDRIGVAEAVDVAGFLKEARHIDRLGYAPRAGYLGWLSERASALAQPPEIPCAPDDLWADWREHLSEHIVDSPHIRRFIGVLKARFEVAILSNGGGQTQRTKLDAMGLSSSFDEEHVIISGEVGAAKPCAEIFDLARARLNVLAREVMHVGDDPEADIEGAFEAGMKTCWVSLGRDTAQAFKGRSAWPDLVITRYQELLEYV